MATLYSSWKREPRIKPFLILWLDEGVYGYNVPEENPGAFARRMHQTMEARALLLWEQKAQALVGTLETRNMRRGWRIPILDHGNVRVLGKPEETAGVNLGLSWLSAES